MSFFIALAIPIDACLKMINNYYKEVEFIKWIEPTNFHLTLKYLGNINPKQIESIKQSFLTIPFFPLHLKIKYINFWKPNLLVLEIQPTAELFTLKKYIDSYIFKHLAISKEEREFSPHVTIARIMSKNVIDKTLDTYLAEVNKKNFSPNLRLNELVLYKSYFSANSPNNYDKICSFLI